MGFFSFALWIFSFALQAALLLRASRGSFLNQFPIFYSYIFFVMATDFVAYVLSFLYPEYYASIFWFFFTFWLVAEFAVIVEVSDHIFRPYRPIRQLGRFLMACVCLIFFVVYVIPPLMHPRSSRAAIFDLVKRTSLTKASLILVLLVAARFFSLPIGKHVSGILLGFATYLSLNITNIALAERYDPAGYGRIFAIVGPSSFILALAIWNVALWQYEPVSPEGRGLERRAENNSGHLINRLGKYDSELTRFFRR
jgi:hypothetical protein